MRRAAGGLMLAALLAGQASALTCEDRIAGRDTGASTAAESSGDRTAAHVHGAGGEHAATRSDGRHSNLSDGAPPMGSHDEQGGHHGRSEDGSACQVLMSCGAMAVLDRAELMPCEARIVMVTEVAPSTSAPSQTGDLELPPPRRV